MTEQQPHWTDRVIAFDTETTGVDVETDRIVTADIVDIRPRQIEGTPFLIDPGVPVPDEAARIHGWTTERIREVGKPPASELPRIADELFRFAREGLPIVIMNAPYDLTILDRELRRHGLPTLDDRLNSEPGTRIYVVDPLVIDRQADKYRRGGRTLTDLCRHYGVTQDGAHESRSDALAAARVAWKQCRTVPALWAYSLPTLHDLQTVWYREQSTSLRRYWQSKDDPRAATVSTEWPMRKFSEPTRDRWWRCRWCGMGEQGLMVPVGEEARRALAHEAECTSRLT
jgi:DNA polymerase-3 subunit epsilon